MPTDLPIACSLSSAGYASRIAEMSAIGESALLSVQAGERHATLRFRSGSNTQAELPEIVAAEADCCAFLDMELRPGAEVTELTIAASPGAEPILDELVEAFRGSRRQEPRLLGLDT